MVRVCRFVVVRAVTRVAVRRRRSCIACRVAACALHAGMGAGKRETRRAMVERGPAPARGRVTLVACVRESLLHMAWICGRCEIGGVARVAVGRCRRHASFVAGLARRRSMRPGKIEAGV
jgi:hypothetical protein